MTSPIYPTPAVVTRDPAAGVAPPSVPLATGEGAGGTGAHFDPRLPGVEGDGCVTVPAGAGRRLAAIPARPRALRAVAS